MNLSAVILAGGESKRMGRDKAWVELDGKPLLPLAVEKVRQLGVKEIFISGRANEDYSALKCPVLLDLEPGFGPLGGIERGLEACSSPLLLVLAVDLPRMTTGFLQCLANHCELLTGAVPQSPDGLEPLAAVYPKCCHGIAVSLLANGRRAARAFAEACAREGLVRFMPVAPGDAGCFSNWNRPEDVAPLVTKV